MVDQKASGAALAPADRAASTRRVRGAGTATRQTIRLLAGRWVPALLTELEHGDRRYRDLHEDLRGVSHKVLTETLRRAERDGLITRSIDSHQLDSAIVYHLTDLGRSLSTPLAALDRWTQTYWHDVETARHRWEQRSHDNRQARADVSDLPASDETPSL